MGVRSIDPLDPWQLAKQLKIAVRTTANFPTLAEKSRRLLENDSGWSAVTLEVGGRKMIILKASNSQARQSSDLTHEVAHQLLGHKATDASISMDGLLMVHAFSRAEEDEANWLSACLLLPRAALIHIKQRFNDNGTAAQAYRVSLAMLKYRMDVTGVNYQVRRSR